MNRGKIYSFFLGLILLVAFGITTDQILQNVYDSSNTALRTNLVAGGSGGTVTGTGTAPDLAAWSSASALTNYAGATCPTPQVATGISASGALTCAVAAATTPTPLVFGTPNVIPMFAATELGSSAITDNGATVSLASRGFSYSGALNSTSITAISASATPAAADRYIACTSGSSADQTYTLPAATGTGRVITVKKIDSGTKACIVAGAGSDKLDGAASVTLSNQYQSVTIFDRASAVWDVI